MELGSFNGTELGSLADSTDGTTDGKVDSLFLGAWLGSLDGLDLDTNEGTELLFPDGKVLGTKIGSAEGPTLGTYDDTDLGPLENFTYGISYGKFGSLLLGARLGLVDWIKIGIDEVTELVSWNGKLLETKIGAIPTWCISW